jgi:hypothetical protein
LAIGIVVCPVAALAQFPAEAIAVNVDQAKLVKLPGRVSTIIVGNPLIADVTLQNGGVVVVTGKGYGATNFIAMDRSGEVLVDRVIQVEGPTDKVVTIYRGVERESYSCMPICQRRVTLGDGDVYFRRRLTRPVLSAVRPAVAALRQPSRRTRTFSVLPESEPNPPALRWAFFTPTVQRCAQRSLPCPLRIDPGSRQARAENS